MVTKHHRNTSTPPKRRSNVLLTIIATAIALLTLNHLRSAKSIGQKRYELSHRNSVVDVHIGRLASKNKKSNINANINANANDNDNYNDNDNSSMPSSIFNWKKRIGSPPLRNDNNSTYSACLLVADDNHYLIEWLAYHYTVLPLRYLVIASDPRARTRPDPILKKWHAHNIMDIVQLEDQDFLPTEWLNRIPDENDSVAKLMKHRERQRHFYPACFQLLKEANREWTMVIDVDEFALLNHHYQPTNTSSAPSGNKTFVNNNTHLFKSNPLVSPTSMSFIQAIQSVSQPNTTCITMPRLRFGNYEEQLNRNTSDATTEEDFSSTSLCSKTYNTGGKGKTEEVSSSISRKWILSSFHHKDFLTYRYRWSADRQSRQVNKLPKSTIHVGRIHTSDLSRSETDAHRPVRKECPRRNLYIPNVDSPFVIHHYTGSEEQFQFRKDARDGTKARSNDKFKQFQAIHSHCDDSAAGWIESFVQLMGEETALRLLEGVGNVNYTEGTLLSRR